MIVFHRKGDLAGRTGQQIGEYIPLYYAEDGFHDTETRKDVPAPENAKELKAAYFADRKAKRDAEQAKEDARRAKEAAYFAMDPCARFVKMAMLRYPSIFPTRIKVLEHAFVVLGNGIEWSNNGDTRDLDGPGAGLVSRSGREPDEEPLGSYEWPRMKYDDLDTRLERTFGDMLRKDRSDSFKEFVEKLEAETAFERKAREEREANIDVLASTPDPSGILQGHYGSPGGILSYQPDPAKFGGYRCCTTIYDMPRNVHPSFFAAALEVIDASVRGSKPGDVNAKTLLKFRRNLIDAFTKGRSKQALRLKKVVTPPPALPTAPAPVEKDEIDKWIDSMDDGTVLTAEDKARLDAKLSPDLDPKAVKAVLEAFEKPLEEPVEEAPKPALAPGRKSNQQAQPRISDDHPVFVDATTGKRIQLREIGPPYYTINVLVNGQAVKACSEYSDAVNYLKWTLGITHDADLEVIYRDYKHDYDKRFP